MWKSFTIHTARKARREKWSCSQRGQMKTSLWCFWCVSVSSFVSHRPDRELNVYMTYATSTFSTRASKPPTRNSKESSPKSFNCPAYSFCTSLRMDILTWHKLRRRSNMIKTSTSVKKLKSSSFILSKINWTESHQNYTKNLSLESSKIRQSFLSKNLSINYPLQEARMEMMFMMLVLKEPHQKCLEWASILIHAF